MNGVVVIIIVVCVSVVQINACLKLLANRINHRMNVSVVTALYIVERVKHEKVKLKNVTGTSLVSEVKVVIFDFSTC